ncbi:MAG: hypothetical protein M0P70_03295 [Desulfobulbaceae bacterium]|nr:hypothetical protein [Desulfobulbaceae bacterium]
MVYAKSLLQKKCDKSRLKQIALYAALCFLARGVSSGKKITGTPEVAGRASGVRNEMMRQVMARSNPKILKRHESHGHKRKNFSIPVYCFLYAFQRQIFSGPAAGNSFGHDEPSA